MEDRMQPISDAAPHAGSRSILTIFRRRLWIMLPVAVILTLAAVIYALAQPRMYEASAWMLVSARAETRRGDMPLVTEQDVWRSVMGDVSMHSRLMRSADTAGRVRDALNLEEPVHSLINRVSIDRAPGTSANVIAITFRSRSPQEAKEVCDTWAEIYEQEAREHSTRSTASAIEYVQNQIETVSGDLRSIEEQMADLEQEYLDTGVNIASTGGSERVSALVSRVAENRVEIEALEAQMARTRSRLDEEPRELEEVEEQPSYQAVAIQQQLSQLHVEHQRKLQDYYEDSPEVTAIREQIARLEDQLEERSEMTRSSVRTQPNPVYLNTQDKLIEQLAALDALRARQTALQSQLAEQRTLAQTAPTGAIAYSEFARQAEGLRSVHSFLLSRLHELELERAMTVSPVQLVRHAEVPRNPVSPDYRAIVGMGLVAALLVAALAGVVVDQIDDSFANPEEIRDALDARLVGALPDVDDAEQLVIARDPTGSPTQNAFANSLRMLSSTVRIEMAREDLVSLTVASAGRTEGKTMVACNLAVALARAGESVLLVDGDMHHPRVHRAFDIPREPGLSDLLLGERQIDEIAQETNLQNLRVISAGAFPASPVDLLASSHGQEIIARIRESADYVIWDTPPAAFLADATVISHETDRTLFVVGRQSRRSAVRQTVQNLREIGVNILGICANQVRPESGSYYQYYYQDYQADEEQ